jgi:hypothetical protein
MITASAHLPDCSGKGAGMAQVEARARQAARHGSDTDPVAASARVGLTARGAVWLLLGALAVQLATGDRSSETDQRGALASLAGHGAGKVVLVLLAVGFVAYALWRLAEAALGRTDDGAWHRVSSAAKGIAYAALAVSTVRLLAGSGSGSQADAQQGWTARALDHSGGRLLVGAVGIAVLVAGGAFVWRGVTTKFEEKLELPRGRTRTVVLALGRIGLPARGVVIGLAGLLVVVAAARHQPEKARGLDGALRTLAAQPYGQALLFATALGLVVFGLYALTEAKYRRT